MIKFKTKSIVISFFFLAFNFAYSQQLSTINNQDIKTNSPNKTFLEGWKSLIENKINNKNQYLYCIQQQNHKSLLDNAMY